MARPLVPAFVAQPFFQRLQMDLRKLAAEARDVRLEAGFVEPWLQMADFCIAAIQGAMLVGKIWKDGRPAERVVEEALNHLKRYAVAPR